MADESLFKHLLFNLRSQVFVRGVHGSLEQHNVLQVDGQLRRERQLVQTLELVLLRRLARFPRCRRRAEKAAAAAAAAALLVLQMQDASVGVRIGDQGVLRASRRLDS